MAFFSIEKQHTDELPDCSGIYRFYNNQQQLLYIGKSINVRSRVKQHYAQARKDNKHQRMMSQVESIDCTPTAGEIGALLLENELIKTEFPLLNHRQRLKRKLFTILLETKGEFLQPHVINFLPQQQRDHDVYGLFSSKKAAIENIKQLAKDDKLCLKRLGLEQGKGPCFNYQLKRCDGACVGEVKAGEHNQQLQDHLASLHIAAWPFDGPIVIEENNAEPLSCQPSKAYHLIHHWAYLGSFSKLSDISMSEKQQHYFDKDAYRIVKKALVRKDIATHLL